MTERILVAGVGNIFCTDDGFGSEAARRLATETLPAGVRVVDYGIRGMHLAYDLLDGYEALVVLDAAPRGGQPGDLVVLEVGPEDLGTGELEVGLVPFSQPEGRPPEHVDAFLRLLDHGGGRIVIGAGEARGRRVP